MQKSASSQGFTNDFDLVIASNVIHASSDILEAVRNLRALLKPRSKMIMLEITEPTIFSGLLLGTFSDFWNGSLDPNFPRHDGLFLSKKTWQALLSQCGFSRLDATLDDYAGQSSSAVLVTTAIEPIGIPAQVVHPISDGLTIIHRREPTEIALRFVELAQRQGLQLKRLSLYDAPSAKYSQHLYLVEINEPIFEDISPVEWLNPRTLLHKAKSLLWVTNGVLLNEGNPSFAMVEGFLRGLKTERRQVQIATLDLDREAVDHTLGATYEFVAAILVDLTSHKAGESYCMGYRLSKGMMYQCFLQPNEVLNQDWQRKQAGSVTPTLTSIRELQDIGLRVVTGKWDHRKSIVFERDPVFEARIANDCVEIAVHVSSIPQEAVSVLAEDCDSSKVLTAFTGTIRVAGSAVCGLEPGDTVCGVGYGICGPLVRTKVSLCQRLTDQDKQEELAAMLLPLCAALYTVGNLARATEDETVLIDGRGGGPVWASA